MLLAYILIPVMQKELDTFKDTVWNSHRIRAQNDTHLPNGVPNHVHSFPEEYGSEECGKYFSLLTLLTSLTVNFVQQS